MKLPCFEMCVCNVTPCVCVFVCNITLSVQRHTVCVFLCDITPCVYVFVWWLCMSYALCFFVCQSTCEYRCVCYVVVKGNMCVLICVDFIFPPLQLNFLNSQSVPFVFIFNLPTWSHADYRRQSVISPSLLLTLCCMGPYFIFNDFIKALFKGSGSACIFSLSSKWRSRLFYIQCRYFSTQSLRSASNLGMLPGCAFSFPSPTSSSIAGAEILGTFSLGVHMTWK